MGERHIVIAGQSGVGKSVVAANVSAALAESGARVMQVGYGMKRDSTAPLHGKRQSLPVRAGVQKRPAVSAAIGFHGVICLEAGSLATGKASAVVSAVNGQILHHAPDFVLHDISWESYGERLLLPFGRDGAEVFVVLSSAFPALNAANNLFRTLNGRAANNGVMLGGIIANNLRASYSESIVADFAAACGCTVAAWVPHSSVVQMCAMYGSTVIEAASRGHHAFVYRKLARVMEEQRAGILPGFLDGDELRAWGRKWAELIRELDGGFITAGACI